MNRFLSVLPKNSSKISSTTNANNMKKRPFTEVHSSPITANTTSSSTNDANNDNSGATHQLGTQQTSSSSYSSHTTKQRKLVQHFLDIGQKNFGVPITCPKCQLLYVADDSEDIKRHRKYCEQVDRLPGLSNRRLNNAAYELDTIQQREEDGGTLRIFYIPAIAEKCIEELQLKVFPLVERDLDSSTEFLSVDFLCETIKLYIIVQKKGDVIGVLIMEDLSPSSKIRFIQHLQDLSELCPLSENAPTSADERAINRIKIGVKAIWIHAKYRRHHLAQQLLEAARGHYMYGSVVRKQALAFSQPTSAGLRFAKRYLARLDNNNNNSANDNSNSSHVDEEAIIDSTCVPCYV